MRTVLFAVAGLLVAISAQAQAQEACDVPVYTEDVVPACLSNKRILLPCYSDPTSYYACSTGSPVLTKCPTAKAYFSYVLQECSTCANYIPAVECSALTVGVKCQAINGTINTTAAPTTVTTAAPSTNSTAKPTTVTTAAPTTVSTSTTTAFPGPPDDTTASGTSTTNSGDGSGTTIAVPQPPSPSDPNVPAPPTPAPTVGTIATGPPEVTSA